MAMEYILRHNTKTGLDGRLKLFRPRLVNRQNKPAHFSGAGYCCASFNVQGARCLAFRSEWGREFTPQWFMPGEHSSALMLASRRGRCSHGYSPFIYIIMPDNRALAIAVCHSGNWAVEITPQGVVSFLQEKEYFSGSLGPRESLRVPSVLTAYGENGFFELCAEVRDWYEKNMLSPSRVPDGCFEWNHWWKYEDEDITEEIFIKNADAAARLGINVCTLDAGWFGSADSECHWTQCRGDWELVNNKRFPHGIRYLSDYVHKKGMLFGIWLEAEALGANSRLMARYANRAAVNTNCTEPYLCLASNGAADWLYTTICTLVQTTRCDWIKLDFNVDPENGCESAQHLHGTRLGLYRHYEALYSVLKRVRKKYKRLIIENCSSGGLRLDMEMLRYTDVSFLSDPDEAPHSLQCLWAASLLISPHRLLHWAHSETRTYPNGQHVFPSFEITSDTPEYEIKAALRACMLHCAGVSRELFSLSQTAWDIFKAEIAFYKAELAPLLQNGSLRSHTPQPLRAGERTDDERSLRLAPEGFLPKPYAAFSLSEGGVAYVLVFSLEKGEKRGLKVQLFENNAQYEILCRDTHECKLQAAKGTALYFEIPFNKNESRVYRVKRI